MGDSLKWYVVEGLLFKGSKKKKSRGVRESKIPRDTPLNVTGGKPITDSYVNAFFKLFSPDQILAFEELYLELKPDTDRLHMTGEIFMRHAKDAYVRYQEYKELDAFQPMDDKGFMYVEESLRKIIKQATRESLRQQ